MPPLFRKNPGVDWQRRPSGLWEPSGSAGQVAGSPHFLLQHYRGPYAQMPTLADGELFLTTDANEWWFGTAAGVNRRVAPPAYHVLPGGRLSAASGNPNSSTNVGGNTLYYTQFIHDLVPLFDGNTWRWYQIPNGEISLSLTGTSVPFTTQTATWSASTGYTLMNVGANPGIVTGMPVQTSTSSASAGTVVSFVNGTSLVLSQATSDTNTGTATFYCPCYDVFIYYDSNAATLKLEVVPWSFANPMTSRNIGLTKLNGMFVKSTDVTHLYLGSVLYDRVDGVGDGLQRRGIWNLYNQEIRPLLYQYSVTSNTVYTVDTWTIFSSSPTSYVEAIIGLGVAQGRSRAMHLDGLLQAFNSSSSPYVATGIGIDSSTVNSAAIRGAIATTQGDPVPSYYDGFPGSGYHAFNLLIISAASGSTSWNGMDANATQVQSGGITGWVWG